jgi:putative transposase
MSYWPHAPAHMFNEKGTYMVTGATYQKECFFSAPSDLDVLQKLLVELAHRYGWHLEAWAVFANHYHFVAQSPTDPTSLKKFISHLHTVSAMHLNQVYKHPGRKIWHQYWDTCITFQNSYLARLNYVIQNPVRHGIVEKATLYPWCSASWFEQTSSPAYFSTVTNFKTDSVNVLDDF